MKVFSAQDTDAMANVMTTDWSENEQYDGRSCSGQTKRGVSPSESYASSTATSPRTPYVESSERPHETAPANPRSFHKPRSVWRRPQESNVRPSTSSSPLPSSPLKPSEASRLRLLGNGSTSQLSTDNAALYIHTTWNIGDANQDDELIKKSNAPCSAGIGLVTPPWTPRAESTNTVESRYRHRDFSRSSSKTTVTNCLDPLRPTLSNTDRTNSESVHTNTRNFSTPLSSPIGRNFMEHNPLPFRGEPTRMSNECSSDGVRASVRSAVTSNSSLLGTTLTERSSVVTKSSSATSLNGRDEGMSVDEAIEMYEGGFVDSDVEENASIARSLPSIEQVDTEFELLEVPKFPSTIIRDSTEIFSGLVNSGSCRTPNSLDGAMSSQIQGRCGASAEDDEYGVTQSSLPAFDDTRDRYGFRKRSQYISLEQYDTWYTTYKDYVARRERKWLSLMRECGLACDHPTTFPAKSNKVKRFIRKGLPPEWRGAAWFWYAGGPKLLTKNPGVYAELTRRAGKGGVNSTDSELIERDLHRTFPDNIRFKPDVPVKCAGRAEGDQDDVPATEQETPLLQSLRRVLQAFSILNPKIGYCQSLNFLAGLLLLFMHEEKAFWMLNIITRVYLPGTHEVNLEGANVDLGVLMRSIKDSMPAIWAKIGGELDGSAGDGRVSIRLPPITLCCTAWFMSCFIGNLPIETTLRVWDSFFYEGSKTLFRISLAVFKVGESEIRALNDPMEVFQVVQTIPRRLIDANALMEACFKRRNGFGHLSQSTIESRRAERRAAYADERARAAGDLPLGRKRTLFQRKFKTIGNGTA